MKRVISLFIFLLGTVCAVAQQPTIEVDYNHIRSIVKETPEVYARLLERFEANDSLLTVDEYATIYYGHSFTANYRGSMERWNSLKELLKGDDLEAAYAEGLKLRKRNPVSLELLSNMIYLADVLKKEEAKSYVNKYIAIVSTILASGDGREEQSAFKVICINDEYQLLRNVLRISTLQQQSLIGNCDVMECEDSDGNSYTFYFDISRSLNYLMEMLGD